MVYVSEKLRHSGDEAPRGVSFFYRATKITYSCKLTKNMQCSFCYYALREGVFKHSARVFPFLRQISGEFYKLRDKERLKARRLRTMCFDEGQSGIPHFVIFRTPLYTKKFVLLSAVKLFTTFRVCRKTLRPRSSTDRTPLS